MDLTKVGRILAGLACAWVCGCGSLDNADGGSSQAVTLIINNPDTNARGSAKALSFSQAKALPASADVSECTITATGPTTASTTVTVASGASKVEATLNIPSASGYTICAECVDTSGKSNNVGVGFKGCAKDVSIVGGDSVAINALFLNLASRSSGDVKYCRVRQDSQSQLQIVCGFNGALTDAQKTTAQCNIEIDTSVAGTSPTTVDSSRSDGFVAGTKGRPYFIVGPGLVTPACYEYNTSGTKLLRGTGSWGTDSSSNTIMQCNIGVKQMEGIASGRKARFAAACTKNGSTWYAIPPSGLAELDTSGGGNSDVSSLIADAASCSTARNGETCSSGWCLGNGTCNTLATPTLSGDVTHYMPTSCTDADCNGAEDRFENGSATNAKFHWPIDLCYSEDGNYMYLMEANNELIRKVDFTVASTSSSYVTTLAGTRDVGGTTNGACSSALFNGPLYCAILNNILYLTEINSHSIRKIDLTQSPCQVSVFAGSATTTGFVNGVGTSARFNFPRGITIDANGTLYIGDSKNYAIRKITSDGTVTTAAGGCNGSNNGTGTAACFGEVEDVTLDPTGTNLYIGDYQNNLIRKMNTATQVVSTLVQNSLAAMAFDLDMDHTGTNLYAAGYATGNTHGVIKIVVSSGALTTVSGSTTTGATNGNGTSATFNSPSGIAISPDGLTVYIVDGKNDRLRKLQ